MIHYSARIRALWGEQQDNNYKLYWHKCFMFYCIPNFADKGPYNHSYGFSRSRVQMWELDHKEGWVPKNWYFWIAVLKKTLESPLDCREIKPVNPKWNQHWIFIGRIDTEAEAPILWPPDAKSRFTGEDPDAVKTQEKSFILSDLANIP